MFWGLKTFIFHGFGVQRCRVLTIYLLQKDLFNFWNAGREKAIVWMGSRQMVPSQDGHLGVSENRGIPKIDGL